MMKSSWRLFIPSPIYFMSVAMAFSIHMPATEPDGPDIRSSVVKITAAVSAPNFLYPWMRLPVSWNQGSGFVIDGDRVLTNAHMVKNSPYILVWRKGMTEKVSARTIFISDTADLALLKIDDPAFFEGVRPLKLDGLVPTHAKVRVYGFPVGGEALSVTEGVVSRTEHQHYLQSLSYLLAVQIDAAINPGNSGGPVICGGGKVVGVVMQSSAGLENTGYMIPAPIVKHFLDDIEDGSIDGFPQLGTQLQSLDNPAMRRMAGMNDSHSGTMVIDVAYESPAENKLFPGDVILSIDGSNVGNDGAIELENGESTACRHAFQMRQIGEETRLSILRDGREMEVKIPLTKAEGAFDLISSDPPEAAPRYLVFGGVVFTPVTENLMLSWRMEDIPSHMLELMTSRRTKERDEVVVALRVLPDDINIGYQGTIQNEVAKLNDETVRNFRHFESLLNNIKSGFVVFEDPSGFRMVFDRTEADAAESRIAETYQLPSAANHSP